jgi:O-antigen/teichoic acid export membrane protein
MSAAKPETIFALPQPTGWRGAVANLRHQPSYPLIVGGSVMMLVGSAIVNGFNFGYNVAVARLLGPAAFGHVSAAVTLLMLVSSITLSFQLVCAKFIARNETVGAKSAVYQALRRRAWIVGIVLAGVIVLTSSQIAGYLNLPSPSIVILLACGIAFYVPLGVKRGALQGTCAFRELTANFVLETVAKFVVVLALVLAGYGVMGAVGAITASVIAAYYLPPLGRQLNHLAEPAIPASFREGMQAIVFFVGQVIINNIDILLVKHFFSPREAGVYAAIALVGRVLYFAAWQIVSAMFPISASARSKGNSSVLVVPLLMVVGISAGFILLLSFFPALIVTSVFGAGFGEADSLLSLYAAATGCYALSVVLMVYEMSRKIANTGWLQLVFSGALVGGICLFHSTLKEVVLVQVALMVALLISVSFPFVKAQFDPVPEAA